MQQYVQGTVLNPPTTATESGVGTAVDGGVVSATVATSLWAGMAITAYLQQPVGFAVAPAQSVGQITGFTVWSDAMLASRDSLVAPAWGPVPLAAANMGVNFVGLGSGALIVLQATAGLVNSLKDASVTTPVSWDFSAQRLIPYSSAAGQLAIQGIVRPIKAALVIVSAGAAVTWQEGPAIVVRV